MIKKIAVAFPLVFFLIFVAEVGAADKGKQDNVKDAPDPSLIAISITFDVPKCDDKDDDTRIAMAVVSSGVVVADDPSVAPMQHFGDPGIYGPFQLVLKSAITKSSFDGSTTKLHITPNGHDTWCTKILVDALFSDNSHFKSSSCNVVQVSEKSPDAAFVNHSSCP